MLPRDVPRVLPGKASMVTENVGHPSNKARLIFDVAWKLTIIRQVSMVGWYTQPTSTYFFKFEYLLTEV